MIEIEIGNNLGFALSVFGIGFCIYAFMKGIDYLTKEG